MIRYKSSRQLSISEFKIPFEAKLDENNRWVVLSKIVPWEEFARLYYKNFKSNRGAPTKDARLVLGVIIIKHIMKSDDRGVIEMIQENPYMQYFLGLEAFTYEQVMTPSLLVSIRKRIDLDVFESLTDDLIRKGLKLKAGTKQEKADTVTKDEEEDNDDDPDPHPGNKGKLQLDATVCDADIKYPTDLDLLNESRQKAEELIDELCLKVNFFFCYPASAGTTGEHVQEEEPSSRRSHREHSSASCTSHRAWQGQGQDGVWRQDQHQPAGWICQGGSF